MASSRIIGKIFASASMRYTVLNNYLITITH